MLFEVRSTKLNTGFKMRPHQPLVQGDDQWPSPPGCTVADTGRDAFGLLEHTAGSCSAALDQHPQIFSARQISGHSVPSL